MILLASPDAARQEHWRISLASSHRLASTCTLADCLRLVTQADQDSPELVLLDSHLPDLDGVHGITRLLATSPNTHVVLLGPDISEDEEWQHFKAGVRGYCPIDSDAGLLQRIVTAVSQGELWMRRSLTQRLINELSQLNTGTLPHDTPPTSSTRLAPLTARELEIAQLIGQGASNKGVARQLDITERTVKAHLTEIFRKLGISDRLKLALLVNGTPLTE